MESDLRHDGASSQFGFTRDVILMALALGLSSCTGDDEGSSTTDEAASSDLGSSTTSGAATDDTFEESDDRAAGTTGGGATNQSPSADDNTTSGSTSDDAAGNATSDDPSERDDAAADDTGVPGTDDPTSDDTTASDDVAADDTSTDVSSMDDSVMDDGPTADDAAIDDGADDGEALDDAATDDSAGDDAASDEPTACDATAAPAIGALGIELVFSSPELSTVSYAVQPPGSDDWYLVEQRGRIMVVSDGSLRPTPFFDMSDEISLSPTYDERGLHSLAFAPDYAESGLFYVVATPTTGALANRDLLFEYRRSEADEYVADPVPARELLSLEGTTASGLLDNIHNAYMAKFGPDGMLYVGMGDGGGECNNAPGFEGLPQDINSPVGKILRFDLNQPEPYAAADNPFVGSGDPRVFHYGVRNPFRFSWDPLTDDFYFGEVGQDTHEEINVAPAGSAGLNFGWPAVEGDEGTCNAGSLATGSQDVKPIFFSTHGGGGFAPACSSSAFCDYSAIVGGAVYRGSSVESLRGAYLFGDWAGNNLAALYHCDGVTSEVQVIDYELDLNLPNNGYLEKVGEGVPNIQNITSIEAAADGELYVTANGNALLKIVPAP